MVAAAKGSGRGCLPPHQRGVTTEARRRRRGCQDGRSRLHRLVLPRSMRAKASGPRYQSVGFEPLSNPWPASVNSALSPTAHPCLPCRLISASSSATGTTCGSLPQPPVAWLSMTWRRSSRTSAARGMPLTLESCLARARRASVLGGGEEGSEWVGRWSSSSRRRASMAPATDPPRQVRPSHRHADPVVLCPR